jgi:mono/diheme cytochrome c family protein
MLKPFLLLSTLAVVVLVPAPLPLLATGSSLQDVNTKTTPAAHERAKKLYAMDCALCHGDNGNGKTEMATSLNVTLSDWTDPKSLSDKSDPDLFDVIRKGKGDKMPPEDAARAKDDDIRALIVYIRGFSKGQSSPPATAAAPPAAPAPGK